MLYVVIVIFMWQRFGKDTAGDTLILRDEFHELENQMRHHQDELAECRKQLADEKVNSESVR